MQSDDHKYKKVGIEKHVRKRNINFKPSHIKPTAHKKKNINSTAKNELFDKTLFDDPGVYQLEGIVEELIEDCLNFFHRIK